MLNHLQIRDFAIVDAVEIEFAPGLTVLTGETGAGKSIVVDALSVVAGGRAGADTVRHGAERAEIAATFDLTHAARPLRDLLDEQSIAAQGELIVRRVVTADGRSRAWLNGQPVPTQLLREVVGALLDIHGQHEFQSLVRAGTQRELLDGYGRLLPLAGQVEAAHRVWLAVLNRLLEIETQAHDRNARLDLLRYQLRELEALDLKEGEAAELLAERSRLAHRGRLAEASQEALQELYEGETGSAHASLSRSLSALRPLLQIDPQLGSIVPLLDEATIRVSEAARELSRYVDSLELDTTRQDQIEQRLAAIEDLSRKHRVGAAELGERRSALQADLQSVEQAEENLATLRKQQAAALASYQELARKLSAARAAAARALGRDISSRMQTLGMTGGRFQADVTPHESAQPEPHGLDQIEFRVTANAGQPLRAVSKVASGGELARLSLAVQVACADTDARCMIFDEVDAGIGGAVAEIVGKELRALARGSQVLCVTHLPQVATQGHQHLRVVKLSDGRTTRTSITRLEGDDRVQELARMLGGVEVTAKAREHAREMLIAAASEESPPAPQGKQARK